MRIIPETGAQPLRHADASAKPASAADKSAELQHIARTGKPTDAGHALRALDRQTSIGHTTHKGMPAAAPAASANSFMASLTADIAAVGRVAGEIGHAASDVTRAAKRGADQVIVGVEKAGPRTVAGDIVRETATQAGRIGHAIVQHRGDPSGFVNWLAGPDGPSIADWTAAVPGLQQGLGTFIDGAMQNPLISGAIGQAFGFEYKSGDFYTTNEGSLQSNFGFHPVYDKVGELLGMNLDDKVMEFESHGVQYKVELWKGSYGAGGAFGGEIGLYTRGGNDRGAFGNLLEKIPGYYSAANGAHQIVTSQTIYDKRTGDSYFTNNGSGTKDGKHYWNLAIRTDPGVRHEDIGQRGTLKMNDPMAAQALCEAMNQRGAEMRAAGKPGSLTANVTDNTVSYVWE